MGLAHNPLINGLIQHTFKKKILFVEKFPVIPFDYMKLFPVDHKSPCYLRRKKMLKTKKIESYFQLGPPPAKPAKQKKQVALENSLRLHTRASPAAAAEAV